MQKIELIQVSSLEKVFLQKRPKESGYQEGFALSGESFAYQVAYTETGDDRAILDLHVHVDSLIKEYISLYRVENVPSELPAHRESYDTDYLTLEPGLFPELLIPMEEENQDGFRSTVGTYRSLWVEVNIPETLGAGTYSINLEFSAEDALPERIEFTLNIGTVPLPSQKLIYTQWFHCDCIADYYKVPIFSEEHWEWIDRFMKMAAEHGINMLLTPVITPPLDTAKNTERPTVQLVEIKKQGEGYSFSFDRLHRYIELCKKNGIYYIEMPPLFTQWGAEFTPKIVVEVNGKEEKLFGWHVKADAPEYAIFLDALLPALVAFLKEEGMGERTFFHISDEPNGEQSLETYGKASKRIREHIKGFPQIDAASHYELYEQGLVEHPIVAVDALEPFLAHNVQPLWCYYCGCQSVNVSNRFYGMPSYRNRILGIQLYKFQARGFLQWGYNFYYTQYSRRLINPFLTTDAGGSFPSGDSFSVFPGENAPLPTVALKVFREGLQDLRALCALEDKIGRDQVLKVLEEGAIEPISFESYPKYPEYLHFLRKRIHELLGSSEV